MSNTEITTEEAETLLRIAGKVIREQEEEISRLQAKVERLEALVERWRSDGFSVADMDGFSGACADELEAALRGES